MKIFRGMLSLVLIGVALSCDAPRLNPLDPQNPNYNIGQIDGYVYSRPHDALPKVNITWKRQNISVETDSLGYYKIDKVEIADGFVSIEKEGFKKDSIRVIWNNQKSIRLEEKILDYTLGQMDGTVKAAAPSLKTLSGVKVFWKNQNLLIATDSQGNFSFNNISYSDGWMFFEIEGYSRDSLFVELNGYAEKVKHLGIIYLNSIPRLQDLQLYSSVVNRYPTVQSDTLYVKAKISDLENDVASVFIRCTELNINKSLSFKSSSGFYENKFTSADLNLNSMDEGIGKNFEISVYNAAGKEFKIGFSTIKRTIRQDIIFKSPANLEIVNKPIKFVWNRFLPGFNFSYNFEIYTEGNSPKLVFGPINFSKEKVEFTADITEINNLPAGQYFWVIWVIDDFQNRARSLPASFVVQ